MEERILKELMGGPLYFKELVARIGNRDGIVKALNSLEKRGVISSELVEQPPITEDNGATVFRWVRQWRLVK